MLSEKDFRRIALGVDGALESSHMGHPDFSRARPHLRDAAAFKPAAGAWGVGGATLVHLPSVDEDVLGEAITMSYQNAAAKAVAKKTMKAGRAGKSGRAGGKKR